MPTPTSYVYTISTEIPSGLVSVARLRQEIELSSIVTMIDFVAGGIVAPGNDTVTIWFKDPLSAGEKVTFDGGASAPAEHPPISGSLLYAHSGLALPDDPQNVNVTGGSVSVTSGTIDSNGKILSPNNVDFLGDAAHPLRVDPTGSTVQPISASSLDVALSTRATESTLSALNTNAADIETILTGIRDTTGVKKITDPLPAGTNNIGDVDVASSALPAGAATEATVATLATQATAALIKAKTDNLDVLLSTRATESTVAAINTATGATGDADTALTVIGRLKQLLTRLPAALISGRLDINNGAWLGSTAPTIGQKTMANSIPIVFPSDQVLAVTTTPSAAAPSLAFGDIALAAITTAALYRTAYTEQSANFTGSIASSSASDAAAGTGARTVRIFYVDATGATAGTEDVTLNGVTFVNLVTATKCFIEKIEVLTVGSTGSNVGILTLKAGLAGAGATVATIGATDNRTFLAHHYVVTGKTANVTGVLIGSNVTNTAGSCIGFLRAKVIGAANAVEKQVSDGITVAGLDSSVFRSYGSQIQVAGPARITLYVTTATGSAFNYRGSFDSYDA